MRQAILLIALALAACQPQALAHVTPSAASATHSPGPAAPPGDLIYMQDPNAPRMLEMDWSGKVRGSVSAQGFGIPSPDGSRFFRSTDRIVVEDWRGHTLGALDADASSYGLGTWADDGQHFCGIVFPPGSGPDAGKASLWVGAPGETGRIVAAVGKPGSQPGVAACSLKNNRAIVAGGLSPHWPPGANRYLITAEIQVVNLTTGAIEFERDYPLGNLGGQLETGPRGDWVLVAASPDARYVAENGIFNGTATIREVPTGKSVATLQGSVRGFSSDGTRIVVDVGTGGSAEVQVATWSDQKVVWRRPGVAVTMLARPNSNDIMIGVTSPSGDNSDLIAVDADGNSRIVIRNASVTWPCPCAIGV
ncbi:MAG TPA: hypothetical protein VHK65_07435 [Candidatus Dormibacteraeota bacterium]|nr:hypothetical protein [Candidatus Dormibacteraeota bacterium]